MFPGSDASANGLEKHVLKLNKKFMHALKQLILYQAKIYKKAFLMNKIQL